MALTVSNVAPTSYTARSVYRRNAGPNTMSPPRRAAPRACLRRRTKPARTVLGPLELASVADAARRVPFGTVPQGKRCSNTTVGVVWDEKHNGRKCQGQPAVVNTRRKPQPQRRQQHNSGRNHQRSRRSAWFPCAGLRQRQALRPSRMGDNYEHAHQPERSSGPQRR